MGLLPGIIEIPSFVFVGAPGTRERACAAPRPCVPAPGQLQAEAGAGDGEHNADSACECERTSARSSG